MFVLRLEADRGVELLAARERRQLDRAHDDPLVGDAEAHALVQPCARGEALEGGGQRLHVGDLAVADDARLERRDSRALIGDEPLTEASAAATALGSMSSPTTGLGAALCHRKEKEKETLLVPVSRPWHRPHLSAVPEGVWFWSFFRPRPRKLESRETHWSVLCQSRSPYQSATASSAGSAPGAAPDLPSRSQTPVDVEA